MDDVRERPAALEEAMIKNHSLLADEMQNVLKRMDEVFADAEEYVQATKKEFESVKTVMNDHESRLEVLEEPYYKRMDQLRIYEEFELWMFGTKIAVEQKGTKFEEFRYNLPREALTLATEDALERGLLTKI
jgi:hypothetical protein